MLYGERQGVRGQSSVRELPLLEGERVEEQFVPYDGLVSDTPIKGQLLALTNLRVISFVQNDGNKELFLAPLEELKGVSVKANTRGLRNFSQGLILIIIGILSYFIIGYILDGVTIALALGTAIVFVGILFVSRYFFWEEEGSITFQGGSWELAFPYRSSRAGADVYKLVDRFFQLKLHTTNTHDPAREKELPRDNLSGPPPSPPPGYHFYDI